MKAPAVAEATATLCMSVSQLANSANISRR
jgi:hypothetical protein